MKKITLSILFIFLVIIQSCKKDETQNTTSVSNLIVDQIIGNYYGNVFMDYPNPTGGYTSIDKFDTLIISKLNDSIMLSSPILGTIKGKGIESSATAFKIKIPYQTNGLRNPVNNEKYTVANGDAELLLQLVNKKITILNDSIETDPCATCTRYRMVSLEK